jgi:hypothetical protein
MPHARCWPWKTQSTDEEDVLDIVQDNPSTSTRRHISSATGRRFLSAVWRTLRENQLYNFLVQPGQWLKPGDKHLRLQFCQWVLHKTVDTPQFLWL